MPKLLTVAALIAALFSASAAVAAEQSARIVELETPLASSQPLQGYLRHPPLFVQCQARYVHRVTARPPWYNVFQAVPGRDGTPPSHFEL